MPDLRDGTTRPHAQVNALLTFYIVTDNMYTMPFRFTNIIFLPFYPLGLYSKFVGEELAKFVGVTFCTHLSYVIRFL